jgi:hypothetical protein
MGQTKEVNIRGSGEPFLVGKVGLAGTGREFDGSARMAGEPARKLASGVAGPAEDADLHAVVDGWAQCRCLMTSCLKKEDREKKRPASDLAFAAGAERVRRVFGRPWL